MLNYIWFNTWGLRQAVRFVLNGYDYGTIVQIGIMAIKEIKYKNRH